MKQFLTEKTKHFMGIKGDAIDSKRLDQEADSLAMVMKDPLNGVRSTALALLQVLDSMPEDFDVSELHQAATNFTSINSRLQDAVRMAVDALKNAAADLRKTEMN